MSRPRHEAEIAQRTNGFCMLFILSSSQRVILVKYTEHAAQNSPRRI